MMLIMKTDNIAEPLFSYETNPPPPPQAQSAPPSARPPPTSHLIVSEARSGGSTNLRTAYPGFGRKGGGNSAAAAAAAAMGPAGGGGKYNWHTVVDGLSEYIRSSSLSAFSPLRRAET